MKTVTTIAEIRKQLADWRARGERIALVPTMGNLHPGHLQLLAQARGRATRTVASIFVNPLQFGPSEDYQMYPRSLEADSVQLATEGLDVLFAPKVGEMYPDGTESMTRVEVPILSDILDGITRPGHFTGVATVVTKLLNIVQPDVALFGEKDYQQLLVIRRAVADLCLPVEIVGVPTVREADGLAMSSRNSYLSEAERAHAPLLYQTLLEVAQRLQHGVDDFTALESEAAVRLRESGFRPDYVSVRRAEDLAVPTLQDSALIVLGAACLGKTRLIDNVKM
jgi:pantoate--beta-alanine ligase